MSDLYIYVDASLTQFSRVVVPELSVATERHKLHIQLPRLQPTTDILAELGHVEANGLIIGIDRGWPGLGNLRIARKAISHGKKVFFYWPAEDAVEVIDAPRLASYQRLWMVLSAYAYLFGPFIQAFRFARSPAVAVTFATLRNKVENQKQLNRELQKLADFSEIAKPVPLNITDQQRLPGPGVYLRTDFWNSINSGGSYGHTYYVARELSRITERVVCFAPQRYTFLNREDIEQVVLPGFQQHNESDLLRASAFYFPILKTALQVLKPAYVYERLCLGNYCGALLSQELQIPYVVEYNGSESSLKRSFEGSGYTYENFYVAAEDAAFRQATVISVVSEPIKADLVARGVPASKILVNPNAVDVDDYKPIEPLKRKTMREEFGWDESHRVIGFTGTFGGWHGIEVLASAIPEICKRVSEARFLLIGDGQFKHLIDDAVSRFNLADRVRSVGRVPQQEGARLLAACDIFVSPHSRNMLNGKFFGSPTKIFEYMSVGGGIVASDLEQIGQVLSPALRATELNGRPVHISKERSVLCRPGKVEDFTNAVEYLIRHPDVAQALGRNARQAVQENHTWSMHIAQLVKSLSEVSARQMQLMPATNFPVSDDIYKHQTQQQWDNDPCGSHYSYGVQPHTLDWFARAESYRYETYAPWMPDAMEFERYEGKRVLEIGAGIGTDLVQFAKHGALVTDVDLSHGHLGLAKQNFAVRGLEGSFCHADAEQLPFTGGIFDLVYTNGVIHHSPNTQQIIDEIYRVLRPGGRVIAMVYGENSWHYWYDLVLKAGGSAGLLNEMSIHEIMSYTVELGESGANPLVKVYTKKRLRNLFKMFSDVGIIRRQLVTSELPIVFQRWVPVQLLGKAIGWNLIVKAQKPS